MSQAPNCIHGGAERGLFCPKCHPKPMKLDSNGFSRRNNVDLHTPAEAAIRTACLAVEEAGTHPLLTEAGQLLQAAKEKVADFMELTALIDETVAAASKLTSLSPEETRQRLNQALLCFPAQAPEHPEDICDDCHGRNVVWFTENDLWNKVARRPDGTDPMLCPRCFILRAEAAGTKTWKICLE